MKTKHTPISSVLEASRRIIENDQAHVVLLVNSARREADISAIGGLPGGTLVFADAYTPERLTGYVSDRPLVIVVDDFATLSWPVIQVLQGYHATGAEIVVES